MLSSFIATAKPVLFSFLLGFAIFGFVGVFGVVFYKGFGIGYVIGSLCVQYGVQALLVSSTCILIPNLLSSVVVCFAAVKCVDFSMSLTKGFVGDAKFTMDKKDVLTHLLRILLFFAAALLCALIDFGLTPLLVKLLLIWI